MINLKNKRYKLYSVITIVITLIIMFYLKHNNAPQLNTNINAAEVVTIKVKKQKVKLEYEYGARVSGVREVEIRAQISGIIKKVYYEEGAKVKAGDILFTIEDGIYLAKVKEAEAVLLQAEINRDQAERENKRIQGLSKSGAVSNKQKEETLSAFKIAQAQVKIAQANYDVAKINYNYTKVVAPICGVTSKVFKTEGNLVNIAGDNLLTTMAQTDPIYANFNIGEDEYLALKNEIEQGNITIPKKGIKVTIQNSPNEGRVDFRDYKADPNTGSFALRATLSNDDNNLAPGQFVKIILHGIKRSEAIIVPQRAVLDNQNGKFVYVVSRDPKGNLVAMPKPVMLGEWLKKAGDLKQGWVIKSGLENNDEVIIDGMAHIFFPFAPINPKSFIPEKKIGKEGSEQLLLGDKKKDK